MVERGIGEVFGVVAIFAAIAGLRMVDCLTHGLHAVVAGHARLSYAAMVKTRDIPLSGGMAAFAFALCNDVIARLTGSIDVVVTA